MEENKMLEEKKAMLEEMFAGKEYKPLRFKDLVGLLQVPRNAKHELKMVLDQMISAGTIILDGQSRYRIPGDDMKVGIFSGNQRGFGFVTIEGEEQDIFIPGDATKGALHGDKVMIT
ncbi:MAG: rnr, partial [Herbinix sp.]|nr:rnr [Herbinix sp.]